MRVLLLGAEASNPTDGGGYTLSQDVLWSLTSRAAASNHSFFVFASAATRTTPWPSHITRLGDARPKLRRARERILHEAKSIFGGVERKEDPYFRELRDQLRTFRVDCALGLTPWAWSPDLPNIVPVWDLEHRRKPYFPEVAALGQWEARERNYREVLPKAIGIYTGTDVNKQQIQHFYGVDPDIITLIPHPTPSFAFVSESARPDLPEGVDREFLFYPAQYWPHKNHIRLLEALASLRTQHGWEPMLVCCGADHGNLSYLTDRARELGVERQVRFLGFIPTPDLIALYQHALALPYVSYFGPENLPPLEAGALGCPVIASAVAGAQEQLGKAAIYVNPDSAEDVAGAIWRLKSDDALRSELVTAGRHRAAQWTVDDYVGRIFEMLDSLEKRYRCFRSTDIFPGSPC